MSAEGFSGTISAIPFPQSGLTRMMMNPTMGVCDGKGRVDLYDREGLEEYRSFESVQRSTVPIYDRPDRLDSRWSLTAALDMLVESRNSPVAAIFNEAELELYYSHMQHAMLGYIS
jgi:hypothetical protein